LSNGIALLVTKQLCCLNIVINQSINVQNCKAPREQISQRRLLQAGISKCHALRPNLKHCLLMPLFFSSEGWSFHITVGANEQKLHWPNWVVHEPRM